jgi:hypothetical protein
VQREGSLCRHLPKYKNSSGTDRDRSDRCMPPVRSVPARPATPRINMSNMTSSTRTRLKSKDGQEIARSGVTNKTKRHICYECRQKGHMGKDCPNCNIPKSNLVHYDFSKIRNDKNAACAMREISAPQTSVRAIWVPKNLVANLGGPNKCWVPKMLTELASCNRCIRHMARRRGNYFRSIGHVEGKIYVNLEFNDISVISALS